MVFTGTDSVIAPALAELTLAYIGTGEIDREVMTCN